MSIRADTNPQTTSKFCVVPVCEGKKFNLVHKFPSDLERFNEWLDAVQKTGPLQKFHGKTPDDIRKRYFVCARHFGVSSYKNVESRSLNITAVPHLNLINLDDYPLSKAFQLEQSQPSSETTPKKLNQPAILNKFAGSALKVESNIKSLKRSFDEMNSKNTANKTQFEAPVIDVPQPIMASVFKIQRPPPIANENPVLNVNVKTLEEKLNDEKPQGKLLALLEVNPAQYKKLLSVINTNSNVVVIDNAENNLNISPDNEVDVCLKGKELKIDKFWLRDHCRCDSCFDNSTHQRRKSVLDIPDDIDINSSQLIDSKLIVKWNDNHESSYDAEFLLQNQHDQLLEGVPKKIFWTKEILSSDKDICRVKMRDYMTDPDVSKKVLEGLYLYGFAFIDGVQATQQNTEFVIRQLFSIHKTLFGEMWTFSDEKKDHMDTAYTNYYLGSHNDNTYFNDASGLQVLHCIMQQCVGGENFLIDGFQVAEKIRKNNPETFERLTKFMVPAEYIEKDRHHKYAAPIINLDPVNEDIMQIRFNLYDRAPLNTLPPNKIRQFYQDLKILATEFENIDNRISFKLEPGTVLIFDNWRVLHGRHAYNGKRTMTGCYVQRSEFMSVLRVNGFIK